MSLGSSNCISLRASGRVGKIDEFPRHDGLDHVARNRGCPDVGRTRSSSCLLVDFGAALGTRLAMAAVPVWVLYSSVVL